MVNSRSQAHITREQLQCTVCCQAYETDMREPVVLPNCGHTFCRLCLCHLQDRQRNFRCPLCRTKHSGSPVYLLPTNFIVMNFLEATEKVESDDCNKETLGEEICFFHLDPLLLWCRQCRQVLCAKCLSQQQHDGHTLHDMRTVLAEKKSHIEGSTNQMLRHLKKERRKLTQEVESVIYELSKIYEKSEKLRLQINKVNGIRKVVGDTNDLKEVAHLELLLHRASKSTSFSDEVFQTLPAHRGNNHIIGDEEMPPNDNAERLTWGEDKSNLQLWPLTRDVAGAGGGRSWPIIPWQSFTAQVPAVQLLVPPHAPEVYLQLEAAGVDLGRVHIRLWGQLRRAQHFLALCLGTFGPSYQGTKFRTVERKGEPGESLRGGDYQETDGKGTSCQGVMTGLEWGGQHAGPVRKGLVGGGGGGCHESDALFNICLQDKPQGKMSCPFGEVVLGLSVVCQAASHQPLSDVTITDAGLVHHNT